MTDQVKYNFFDQSFSTASIKKEIDNKPYVELAYPGDNIPPVLKYKDLTYYPIKLIVSKGDGANKYQIVIQTVSKTNGVLGSNLYIHIKVERDVTATAVDGPLTALFSAISKSGSSPGNAIVMLNSLFGLADISNANHEIYKKSSDDLTLYITPTFTSKLADLTPILNNNADVFSIFKTMTPVSADATKNSITLVASPLTQRQRCTRSTDKASPAVSVLAKPNPSNVQTNILVIVIIGLCVAAFFPSIYSGLVCLPAGETGKHGAIHMIYLFGAMSISIPLFVRGFKEGDLEAQAWSVGLIGIMLIFFWQYTFLSKKMMLQCGTTNVAELSLMTQIGQFFESKTVSIPLIVALVALLIPACVKAGDDTIFRSLMGTQISIILAALVAFRFLVK